MTEPDHVPHSVDAPVRLHEILQDGTPTGEMVESIDADTLPEVGGRFLNDSLDGFKRRARLYIRIELGKIAPDNGLVSVLCDAVRLAREHGDAMTARQPNARLDRQEEAR